MIYASELRRVPASVEETFVPEGQRSPQDSPFCVCKHNRKEGFFWFKTGPLEWLIIVFSGSCGHVTISVKNS